MLLIFLIYSLPFCSIALAQNSEPTATATAGVAPLGVESTTDPSQIESLVEEKLSTMSVADRVGQLFLITFDGDDVGFESDIAELIYGYRVGGVVLDPANQNFSNGTGEDTPRQVATLNNRLQALAYGLLLPEETALEPLPEGWSSDPEALLEDLTSVAPVNIPLFIGVQQLGDGLPETALRRGFTPLPSQMAIGASWDPALATEIGEIVGAEMQAVGVNMLLGPNLDVLENPKSDPVGRLGIHMYGGDPYWVGRMGKAYITGVHAGSHGQIATIPGHFPGAGDIDRLPEEEVSTVQRPLAELESVALPPFRAVTRGPANGSPIQALSITDGLMSSHARYNALQGSSLGRNTPISLAPELETVLAQQGFSDWRANGGILVSAELGAPAIRRHYTASPTDFPFRRIALDAFTAGHDLLYTGRFASDDTWESQRMNIKETIGFFQERYVNDPDFAQDVDDRVRRIVALKLRLYGARVTSSTESPIPLESVLVQDDALASLGEGRAASLASVAQVARESISVLYPDPREAAEVVSRIPQDGEKILIISDSRLDKECADCVVDVPIAPDDFRNIILRLYGPEATDQLVGDEITSITFTDLDEFLKTPQASDAASAAIPTVTPLPTALPEATEAAQGNAPPAPTDEAAESDEDSGLSKSEKTAKAIKDASWILFAMLDVDEASQPQSTVVKRFLRQHSDDLASKNVAVFALNAPYFLDATEISKLNAYYGVYGKTQPFLEDAVRALFRSFTPNAAPPVSVAGTRFSSLAERLAPDPDLSVDLRIASHDGSILVDPLLNEEEAPPVIDSDTQVQLQAGPIVDRNGNPVRDGETVEFVVTFDGDTAAQRVEQALTRSGMATRDLQPDRGGVMQVAARVGEAVSEKPLQLVVQSPAMAEAESESADAQVTAPAPTQTPAQVAMAERADPVAITQPVVEPPLPSPMNLASLVISLLTITVMVSMLLILQVRVLPRRTLVHSILWAVNCGLVAYILYGYGLIPGSDWLQGSLRIWGTALVVFVAMLLPLLWLQLRSEQ
ncbi:MAG: glycoside hydrolase family 3 N-terminal domain-containing protein [Caldilineaceae bacterium]